MPAETACFCGRGRPAASQPRFTAKETAGAGEFAARLRACEACRLTYLDAPEAPLGGGYEFAGPVEALIRTLWRRRAAWMASLVRPGARALDVGAGLGKLVNALVERGVDAVGLEPAARGADAGPRVVAGTIADGLPGSEPFDLVVFWHSLEHHPEPFTDLVRVSERMRPGAALVIAVPNAGSWQARLAGPRWLHLDLPHHRAHFTPETLGELVRDAGFTVERVATGHVEMDLAGMLDALCVRLGLPPRFCFEALQSASGFSARVRQVAGLVLTALLLPCVVFLCALARLSGNAGTLRLVARRAEGPDKVSAGSERARTSAGATA